MSSNVKKRATVELLLQQDEKHAWRTPDRQIARQAGVSHPFVAKMRREREEQADGNGYRSVAKVTNTDLSPEKPARIPQESNESGYDRGTGVPYRSPVIERPQPLEALEPEPEDDAAAAMQALIAEDAAKLSSFERAPIRTMPEGITKRHVL